MGDDLIAAHGDIEKLMPFLHLPVQSGSDSVLAAMNRQHTADDYRASDRAHPRRAARHRASRPISLSAFPARATRISKRRCSWCATSNIAQCFSFKYSPRPGTPAAAREEADCRKREERAAAMCCRSCFCRSRMPPTRPPSARPWPVLFEKPGPRAGPDRGPHALSAIPSMSKRRAA